MFAPLPLCVNSLPRPHVLLALVAPLLLARVCRRGVVPFRPARVATPRLLGVLARLLKDRCVEVRGAPVAQVLSGALLPWAVGWVVDLLVLMSLYGRSRVKGEAHPPRPVALSPPLLRPPLAAFPLRAPLLQTLQVAQRV